MSTQRCLGIDLGGSKIEGVVLQGDSVLQRQRVPTPSGDYRASLQAIADLVADLEAATGSSALPLGLGHPGSIDPRSGRLRNANSTCLNGQAFAQDLERLLGRPLRLANDANCLALSESQDGAAAGADSAFFVILGTGVGGAIISHGRLQTGANALGGEWGHNPLPWPQADEWPGPHCWCGQRSCIEAWLGGPALLQQYQAAGGEAVDVPGLVAASRAGETEAVQALDRYMDRLARSLATIINTLDPELIVLAGGLSQIDEIYDRVPQLWQSWVFAEQVNTGLIAARHGDSSGVLGAARLALDSLQNDQ